MAAKLPDFESRYLDTIDSELRENRKFRKEVRNKMSRILTQTTRTNGRVDTLEGKVSDLETKKKSIISDRLSGKTVWLVLIIILALVYIVANQTNTKLPEEIFSETN